jgi:PAS domain S-box-containing protein
MNLSPEEFHPLTELAAEKAAEGLLCLETDGRILYANDAAARTLAETAAALAGRTIFQIAPEMNPALWQELWKEIRSHASFAFEFALCAAEERLVQVEVTVHYLKPARRELACVFFRDIEERKRLQNLQQEFVSTASHELRTPMTVIREGVSQVLEGLRGDINDTQRRALTLALNGIDRLGRIIDELLDISKIESGKVTLRRERLDLAVLAREAGATFQSLATDRGLDLRLTTPAGPVMIYGDRDRLVQVLTNLVNNSFKFTEKGHIQITVTVREGEAECAVSDTGMGLAPADAEKIFNKFEQLGQVAVTGEKGTGLGLSICRGIIELHKGRIGAESAGVGKGARVAFVIPRQTGKDVFREQLAPMLRNVARRGGSLSTVIFQIGNPEATPATEAQMTSLLGGLENLIRKHSGRKTDFLVKDVNAMYLALESMVKREATRIADRIVSAFEESLAREGLKSRLHMTYTIMGFPEEGTGEEAYLDKVCGRDGGPA